MASAIATLERALAEARSARAAASQSLLDAQLAVGAARAASESAEGAARIKASRADDILSDISTSAPSSSNYANEEEESEMTAAMTPVRRSASPLDFTASVTVSGVVPHAPLSKICVIFSVLRGEPMEGCEGPEENDFLGLYLADTVATPVAAQQEHLYVTYVDGATDGTIVLQLPSMAGSYSVWYVHASGTVAARSPAFEIAPEPLHKPSTDAPPRLSAPIPLANTPNKAASASTTATMFETLSARSHLLPPYILEVLPRISVVQLIVPLPIYLRSRTKNAPAARSPVGPVLLLPYGWTPGIEIEGDVPGSTDAAIVFAMELPRIGPTSAYEASPSDVAAADASSNSISSLARDFFLLRLPLTNRIERSKVVMTVFPDHISVRMPFFFAGSILPERPTSLVALSEMSSLRSHGREVACRFCAAEILGQSTPTPTSTPMQMPTQMPAQMPTPPSSSSSGLRVLLLPSEYWLEWSEYWLCHQGQENIYLPRDDDGELCALKGTALLGETHMQVHVSDVRPGAVLLRPSAVIGDLSAGDMNWWTESALLVDSDSTSNIVTALGFDVECARCASVLGSLSTSVSVISAVQLAAALRSGSAGDTVCTANLFPATPGGLSLSPFLFEVDDFPARLTANRHPSLRLHKDRLSLRIDAGPKDAPPINRPVLRDAFELYAVSSRIASTMLAAALAHGQFWFVWAQSSGATTSEARVLVGLLNWNTAIRGAGWPASESGCALPWEKGGDVAAAKVRFRVLQMPLSEDDRAATIAWGGASALAAQVIRLSADEVDEAIAILGTSMALLPRSARLIDGCSVGFIPFLAGPLRLAGRQKASSNSG